MKFVSQIKLAPRDSIVYLFRSKKPIKSLKKRIFFEAFSGGCMFIIHNYVLLSQLPLEWLSIYDATNVSSIFLTSSVNFCRSAKSSPGTTSKAVEFIELTPKSFQSRKTNLGGPRTRGIRESILANLESTKKGNIFGNLGSPLFQIIFYSEEFDWQEYSVKPIKILLNVPRRLH